MPKLQIPDKIAELITQLQKAAEPYKEENPIVSEQQLQEEKLNHITGAQHRKFNPELYTANASRILDFFIYEVPRILQQIVASFDDKTSVPSMLNTIRKRMDQAINPAAFYLDDQTVVPNLSACIQSEKLYKKMLLLEWFLTKLSDMTLSQPPVVRPEVATLLAHMIHGSHNEQLRLIQDNKVSWAIWSVLKMMPNRKRLPSVTEGLNTYAQKYNFKRLAIDETAAELLKQIVIKPAEEIKDEPVVNENESDEFVVLTTNPNSPPVIAQDEKKQEITPPIQAQEDIQPRKPDIHIESPHANPPQAPEPEHKNPLSEIPEEEIAAAIEEIDALELQDAERILTKLSKQLAKSKGKLPTEELEQRAFLLSLMQARYDERKREQEEENERQKQLVEEVKAHAARVKAPAGSNTKCNTPFFT